ncbi:hypothetical protein ACFVIM_13630 [Streptomyces sp. NPDC057638]|uniref:hypothetical protein n=1 Tax=Streptomyces sp. NPDC057638 TaxID=3346190 RepID=UPI00368E98DD
MSMPRLPDGWTLERLRAVSGDADARPLGCDRTVVVDDSRSSCVPLQPDMILAFHDLCLVHDDGDWYMGRLNPDSSITCWASYGTSLRDAIRAL